jgi:uncharacterized protein YbjT (DUF2867 family)
MKKVLVTAASGNAGKNIVEALVTKGFSVVAASRDPGKLAFPAAVETRRYDANGDTDFDVLFEGITDFALVGPPLDGKVNEKLTAIIGAAAAKNIDHLVYLSGNYLSGLTGKTYDALPIRDIERQVIASGIKHTIVRAGFFMDNYLSGFYAPMVEKGKIALATGNGKSALVSGADVGLFVAEAFAQGATGEYLVTGPEALDHHEVAELLSARLGRSIVYEPISEEALKAAYAARGLPEESAAYGLTLYRAYRNHATAAVTDGFFQLTGRNPESFSAYLARV